MKAFGTPDSTKISRLSPHSADRSLSHLTPRQIYQWILEKDSDSYYSSPTSSIGAISLNDFTDDSSTASPLISFTPKRLRENDDLLDQKRECKRQRLWDGIHD